MTRLTLELSEVDVERIADAVAARLAAQRPEAPQRGDELLTVVEAAEMLRCSPRWVRQLLAEGRLPATRIGTGSRPRVWIPRSAVQRLIDESTR